MPIFNYFMWSIRTIIPKYTQLMWSSTRVCLQISNKFALCFAFCDRIVQIWSLICCPICELLQRNMLSRGREFVGGEFWKIIVCFIEIYEINASQCNIHNFNSRILEIQLQYLWISYHWYSISSN